MLREMGNRINRGDIISAFKSIQYLLSIRCGAPAFVTSGVAFGADCRRRVATFLTFFSLYIFLPSYKFFF
jgi:hypothetical protein